MLDAAGGELEHLDRISTRQDQVSDVEAETCLRPDQEALDVIGPLDGAAESRLHGQAQLVAGADVLDRPDRVEQVRPLRVGQSGAVTRAARAFRDRRQDKGVGAQHGKPVRVTIYVGKLGTADVLVMKDGVNLAGHQAQAVTPEQRFCLVASIGKKSGRPGGDRAFADRRRF